MPCAIILAAGASTRLGQPKQNIRIGGETLLERSIRSAHLAALAPIFVIVSSISAAEMSPTNVPFELIANHDAAEGMASSIRMGVQAAIDAVATGSVIIACDQIAVTPEHLCGLIAEETQNPRFLLCRTQRHPAYFPRKFFDELLQLTGDTGARDLLHRAAALHLRNGDLDIDTPADLARARHLLASITIE